MMLEHFGHHEAAEVVMKAIEQTLEHAGPSVITPDLGGKGDCEALGKHIAHLIETL